MKIAHNSYFLALVAVFAMLACGLTPSYAITVYNFQGSPNDGGGSDASLVYVPQTNLFYGTTKVGGLFGRGTVFSVDTSGAAIEHVIYNFQGGANDGSGPEDGLVAIGNVLYGSTREGGAFSGGTVFSLTIGSSNDHILHSFGAPGDGDNPRGRIMILGSNIYGTTAEGGTGINCPNTTSDTHCGTVFRVSICECGSYSVLYSFKGTATHDGATPYSGVTYWLDANNVGWLYGTTALGGASSICPPQTTPNGGCGTIFRLHLDGSSETVLHSFAGGADGFNPYNTSGLLQVGQFLYGTTYDGGPGDGTLFRWPLAGGTYGSVGSPNPTATGEHFSGSLTYYSKNNSDWLYGTSYHGGTGTCYAGCGLVFKTKINVSTGAFSPLQQVMQFAGSPDGGHPYAGAIYWHQVSGGGSDWLYGTTEEGGPANTTGCTNLQSCGTVFRYPLP